ncbi:MAG: methyltransferase domain-containing protein [Candidatus Lokiarchaeota archaeon]|nr:methyltransferase domain-containing protein [Candidatus Lokiarchaeota archaeon]
MHHAQEVRFLSFDEIAIAYDNAINWESRLDREIPFIIKSLKDEEAAKILDIACGSGRHAIELASRGAYVIAFDNSSSMIQQAKNFADSANSSPRFLILEMLEMEKEVSESFDLALCLGNSLALLNDWNEVEHVIRTVRNLLNQEGKFIFQTLNFTEIIKNDFRLFPLKRGYTPSGKEIVFGRFFDHDTNSQQTHLIMSSFVKTGKEWTVTSSKQKILRIQKENIEEILLRAGFNQVEFYSDYNKSSFVPTTSRSMIVRAQ